MSFDKVKAMRDAERFLAQGKLRAAISEYKRVVEADKTDFNTLNMLGDLYVKASETDEAIKCFTQVAEHYSKQGFAQKAIAIYNKISRFKPDSIEVSAKLAQLYQMKGSLAEARTHYTTVAEQYTKKGKKAEALSVWKQIANLDPNNTDIYLKIADACWQDQQKEEAANAYIEAGNRLSKKSQYESAITAFSRALEIRPDDLPALRGYVKSQIGLGYADEAAKSLESSLARQPHSREIINLLADCYIEAGNLAEAEKTIVQLVEKEPTHYPKLLEIFQAYLKAKNISSAARMLTMASEHMLVGGRAVELEQKIEEILDFNSDDLDGIRLLVRFHNWQRDEAGIKTSMERLAEAARVNNAVEDERYALSQLVLLAPQNIYFAQRLQELNLANGYSEGFYQNSQSANGSGSDVPTFESYSVLGQEDEPGYAEYKGDLEYVNGNGNEHPEEEGETVEAVSEEANTDSDSESREAAYRELTEFEKHGLQTEIEGIDFYVEQGFFDLAEKTLEEIESRYGEQPEINGLREILKAKFPSNESEEETAAETSQSEEVETEESLQTEETESAESVQAEEMESAESVQTEETETVESLQFDEAETIEAAETEATEVSETIEEAEPEDTETIAEGEPEVAEAIEETDPEVAETIETTETEDIEPTEEVSEQNQPEEIVEESAERIVENEDAESPAAEESEEVPPPQTNPFEEMKTELSSIGNNASEIPKSETETYDDDFETSYQTGIVYREMGLIEDSIREFQEAIKRVTPQDGTRRFFLCCNMLGLCFMEKQMPTIAIMWLKQGLESNHLSDFELNGMRYELANAYEKAGDKQKAQQLFEEIYAVDVSFRDVGTRLQSLIAA